MEFATVGIDIGKGSFHVVGLDARGAIVLRRRCSRKQLMRNVANLPPCLDMWVADRRRTTQIADHSRWNFR